MTRFLTGDWTWDLPLTCSDNIATCPIDVKNAWEQRWNESKCLIVLLTKQTIGKHNLWIQINLIQHNNTYILRMSYIPSMVRYKTKCIHYHVCFHVRQELFVRIWYIMIYLEEFTIFKTSACLCDCVQWLITRAWFPDSTWLDPLR